MHQTKLDTMDSAKDRAASTAQSIFGAATKAHVMREPYPHMIIEDALQPDYYRALEASFPSLAFVSGGADIENNRIYLRPAVDVRKDSAVAAIWQDFFDYHTSSRFFAEAMRVLGDAIRTEYPELEQKFGKPLDGLDIGLRQKGKRKNERNRAHDVMLDCVFGTHSPVDRVTSARGVHVDSPAKLFSALLYFRADDDDSVGGDYELYRLRSGVYPKRHYKAIPEKYVEKVCSVPYRPNTVVAWINTSRSIHAVAPRGITRHSRRYVAVTAECYAGETADYFLRHDDWEKPIARLRSLLRI